jgi:hypothetical protein
MEVVVDHRGDNVERITQPPSGGPGGKMLRVGHVEGGGEGSASINVPPHLQFREYAVFEVDGQIKAVFPHDSQCKQVIEQNIHAFKSMGKRCHLHIMQLDNRKPHKVLKF